MHTEGPIKAPGDETRFLRVSTWRDKAKERNQNSWLWGRQAEGRDSIPMPKSREESLKK